MSNVTTTHHPILGDLMPVQGPFATYFSVNDDYDLSLYIDGPVWLVKVEIDYLSTFTQTVETVEKEFALDARYLEALGRGGFVNRFEELYDRIANEQLQFIGITTRIEVRNAIMDLMQEAFDRLDRGEKP